MSLTDLDRQKYSAALELLEAEQRRRDDERVAAGTAVRLPLYLVGEQDTEEAKARKLAELRAVGDQRDVIFDEPFTITTGVPRPAKKPEWDAELAPQYPDRYAKERQGRSEPQDDGLMEPPAPVEWHRFTTTVRNPSGKADDHGQVDENLYSIQGDGVLCVKDLGGHQIGTYQLQDGDEILTAARRVVRDRGKHGAFWDPITLPEKPRP